MVFNFATAPNFARAPKPWNRCTACRSVRRLPKSMQSAWRALCDKERRNASADGDETPRGSASPLPSTQHPQGRPCIALPWRKRRGDPLFKSEIRNHHSAIKPAGFDVSHEAAKARRNWMDAESCFIVPAERESALLMPAREWGGLSWSNSAKNHGVGVTSRRTKRLPKPVGRV